MRDTNGTGLAPQTRHRSELRVYSPFPHTALLKSYEDGLPGLGDVEAFGQGNCLAVEPELKPRAVWL